MAKFILAPVWSMEWKVALIVLLSVAILVCVILIAYVAIAWKKTKRRAADDDYEARDDGGFSKIVRAEDYGVTMPPQYSLKKQADVVVPSPRIRPVSLNQTANVQPAEYSSAPQYGANYGALPVPADISARLGYIPAPYGSSEPPRFEPPQNVQAEVRYVVPVQAVEQPRSAANPNGAKDNK